MESTNEYAKMLNSATPQFKKLSDLEINKKDNIEFFETQTGKYGDNLIAIIDGYKVSLPTRYNKFIPFIDGLNSNPLHLIYKGKKQINNREMHDLEFV